MVEEEEQKLNLERASRAERRCLRECLELEVAFEIEERIPGETSAVFSEALVKRIVAHSIAAIFDAGMEIVEVVVVFAAIDLTTRFVDTSSAGVAVRFIPRSRGRRTTSMSRDTCGEKKGRSEH